MKNTDRLLYKEPITVRLCNCIRNHLMARGLGFIDYEAITVGQALSIKPEELILTANVGRKTLNEFKEWRASIPTEWDIPFYMMCGG